METSQNSWKLMESFFFLKKNFMKMKLKGQYKRIILTTRCKKTKSNPLKSTQDFGWRNDLKARQCLLIPSSASKFIFEFTQRLAFGKRHWRAEQDLAPLPPCLLYGQRYLTYAGSPLNNMYRVAYTIILCRLRWPLLSKSYDLYPQSYD